MAKFGKKVAKKKVVKKVAEAVVEVDRRAEIKARMALNEGVKKVRKHG